MTQKFHMPVTVTILMVQRVNAARMRGQSMEARLPDEIAKWDEIYNQLGHQIRRDLQSEGFVKDCEIDQRMEFLAEKAANACDELSLYISLNSITLANEAAALGITSMRDWQDSHPSPIRPDRRH